MKQIDFMVVCWKMYESEVGGFIDSLEGVRRSKVLHGDDALDNTYFYGHSENGEIFMNMIDLIGEMNIHCSVII